MPAGQRDRSFFSSPSPTAASTLVDATISEMETPRCTRIRRRFGPKALSLMARTLPQERYQRRDAVEGTKGVRPRRGTFRFSTVDYGFRGRRERRGRATGSIGEDKCLLFSLCSSLFC